MAYLINLNYLISLIKSSFKRLIYLYHSLQWKVQLYREGILKYFWCWSTLKIDEKTNLILFCFILFLISIFFLSFKNTKVDIY